MATIDRTLILKSPGAVTYNGATILSQGDITVELITEYFEVGSSPFGAVSRRVQDRRVEISLTPLMWNDLAKLFPYATKNIGDTIYGGTDLPLVITPRNGAPLTVANVAVTALPSIKLSATQSIMGSMKFTGLCANAADPATVANFFSFGVAASAVALTGLDLSKIPNALYTLALNAVNYRSSDGFSIDFDLGLDADKPDGDPTVNMRVTKLDARMRFTPVGLTEAQYATLLSLGMAFGIGAAPTGYAAAITSSAGPSVSLGNTILTTGRVGYGATLDRTGEIELQSVRTVTAGNLAALWTIS